MQMKLCLEQLENSCLNARMNTGIEENQMLFTLYTFKYVKPLYW